MAQLVKWSEIDLKGYQPLSENDSEDFLVKYKFLSDPVFKTFKELLYLKFKFCLPSGKC